MRCPVKKIILLVLAFCCLSGLFLVTSSYAVIYKYTDNEGIVSFADDLQAVPEKYRTTAVIVEGESKEERANQGDSVGSAHPEQQPSAAETKQISDAKHPGPLSSRLMMSAGISVGAFLVFILISKQPELKENKKVLSFIRTGLIASVSLYLIVAHIRDVWTVFGLTGKTISEAQQQSAEKGKKAAQTIKQLDALFEQAQQAQQAEESKAKESEGDKGR